MTEANTTLEDTNVPGLSPSESSAAVVGTSRTELPTTTDAGKDESTDADAADATASPSGVPPSAAAAEEEVMSFEERLGVEMEKARAMKISDLKMKLMARGVLTSTFCEKDEFVRAYAEQQLAASAAAGRTPSSSSSEAPTTTAAATVPSCSLGRAFADDDDDEGDDGDDDSGSEDGPNAMMDKLPPYLKHRVDRLKALNDEREELMGKYLVERARLEAKYRQLEQPLYRRRRDIVRGEMDDDIAKEHDEDEKEPLPDPTDSPDGRAKGVPQFWACALNQMPVTGELITEQDVDCLESLEDITCSDYENGEGFTLEFHFAPNEYFENTVLTKKYDVPNLLLADEPILKNVEGCEIKWKPGRCLTYVEVTKQQRGKGRNAGHIRAVTKKERSESFFSFFTPPKLPSMESMDEQEAARLEAAFDEDYDAAQALRSHIIPKAVMWFAGNAMDKEMEAAMEGMEWPAEGGGPISGGENPECKQS